MKHGKVATIFFRKALQNRRRLLRDSVIRSFIYSYNYTTIFITLMRNSYGVGKRAFAITLPTLAKTLLCVSVIPVIWNFRSPIASTLLSLRILDSRKPMKGRGFTLSLLVVGSISPYSARYIPYEACCVSSIVGDFLFLG